MAVSIDRWSPGDKVRRVRRSAQPPRVSARRGVRPAIAAAPLPAPHLHTDFAPCHGPAPSPIALRFFTGWLALGTMLLLTCPPLWSAGTVLGALPLWLAGLPAASLAVLAIARRPIPTAESRNFAS